LLKQIEIIELLKSLEVDFMKLVFALKGRISIARGFNPGERR
jgi:hypothetical protein